MNSVEQLQKIFKQTRTIAVVGLSADWSRPSYIAAKYMQEQGFRVIPVNPRYAASSTPILGERCYAELGEIPETVDMVDVFRRTEDVPPIAQQAIQIGAKCLWQQLGVMNLEADQLVRGSGLESVMDRCVKIEYARLFGGLNLAGVATGLHDRGHGALQKS